MVETSIYKNLGNIMGVMPCSRKDCDNILCDRYATGYGYICNMCFDEMVEKQTEDSDFTIGSFLSSSKHGKDSEIDLEKVFPISN